MCEAVAVRDVRGRAQAEGLAVSIWLPCPDNDTYNAYKSTAAVIVALSEVTVHRALLQTTWPLRVRTNTVHKRPQFLATPVLRLDKILCQAVTYHVMERHMGFVQSRLSVRIPLGSSR